MSPSASLPEAQGRLSPGRRSAHSASELSADAPAGVDSAETILSPLEQDARTPGPPCQPPPEGALRSIPPKWPPARRREDAHNADPRRASWARGHKRRSRRSARGCTTAEAAGRAIGSAGALGQPHGQRQQRGLG
ncbi:uncharacterized protein LOC115280664 isoform X2 [Suricata suricatta]|uniref:uncharacterized protein LOC115280664 isoform X2 n=1 Tax=Suricata suricatta TaxID=37032 RepID=UPI001155B27F|nr:uncharacterized protein LOC115280664 isoform X2 [Suricata suricatta]